jgi:hypothetical protein
MVFSASTHLKRGIRFAFVHAVLVRIFLEEPQPLFIGKIAIPSESEFQTMNLVMRNEMELHLSGLIALRLSSVRMIFGFTIIDVCFLRKSSKANLVG